ncbi:site-specific recombinase XerD [Haloactinopolyspora alba]|uniref:Site-specific recombinase XerD n=1 Tax=Haloactinopolyspora alba TaxID=648780 RepID=A0A2P8DZ60_9ACTN|nr:tyrosine-type recombinase/integrase [Haloactinopolyspora alba]PSL02505.1 site-specific recombinase XerD [Haloactinopolyspora alba]
MTHADWEAVVVSWQRSMRSAGRADSTTRKRGWQVRRLAADVAPLGPFDVTHDDLVEWMAGKSWEASTRYPYRSAVRAFYRWAVEVGHIDESPAERLPRENLVVLSVPGAWEAPVRAWVRSMRVEGKPETTVNVRVQQLRRVAAGLSPLGPFDVTLDDLVEWMAGKSWLNETRRSHRSSLRSFYRWAVKAGHIDESPAEDLPKVRASSPRPHPAPEDAYRFAVLTAEPRERLMLRLAAEMGLRRGEVAKVHTRDLVQRDGGWSLIVHGKGNRDRVIPLPDGILSELRSLPPGYAFGSPAGGHLGAEYVGKLVAQLLPAGWAMHALRHRFATLAYSIDHDLAAVQELLGHSSPAITRRYVDVPDTDMRRLVDLVGKTNNQPTRATTGG